MNIERKTTEKITWDIDLCKAEGEITIEDGKILGQNICIFKEPETQESIGNRFSSDDPQFIRDVHRALGEYIQHVEGIMRGVTYKEITPESYDEPSKGNVGTYADVQPQSPELD